MGLIKSLTLCTIIESGDWKCDCCMLHRLLRDAVREMVRKLFVVGHKFRLDLKLLLKGFGLAIPCLKIVFSVADALDGSTAGQETFDIIEMEA